MAEIIKSKEIFKYTNQRIVILDDPKEKTD